MPENNQHHHEWPYTEHILGEFGDAYMERKLIGRDMDVRGGVYYGTYGGEAIVVDPEKYPEQCEIYYDEALKRAGNFGVVRPERVSGAVFDTVYNRMAYSQS